MTTPVRASLGFRTAKSFLGMPQPLLNRLSGVTEPVVRDGRVLHSSLAALLALSERLNVSRSTSDVATRRAELNRFAAVGMPLRTDVRVRGRVADLDTTSCPVRIYRPFGITEALPGIVYFHGGGWVTGGLDSHEGTCRLLAAEARAVVVSVDYRLAPEHPFPAAVDDGVAAYRWCVDHAGELGVVATRIGVMGDSAGGTLAAVTARACALEGAVRRRPAPVAQGLVYPATDAHLTSRSHDLFAEGFFLSRDDMEWFRGHYLPNRSDWDDRRASPLLAEQFEGLPPALVVTAGFDPLRDEGDAYAAKLVDAGVPVIHRCYDDMVHGFFGMGVIPGGLDTCAEICRAMGTLLHDG